MRGWRIAILASILIWLAGCSPAAASCSVGVRGAAAVVEVSGYGASAECDRLATGQGDEFYLTEAQPSKPIVCVVPIGDLTYTVRDEGMLKAIGNSICQSLTITPEPTATEEIWPTFEPLEFGTAAPLPPELPEPTEPPSE